VLYAYFEKHLYDVTFEYEDGQDTPIYKVKKYAYGDRILDPGLVPYKKDDLSDAERYSFKGFIEAKNAGSENPDIIDFNTLTCKGTSHYKSFFKKESVYDSVSNLDWFEFSPVNNPKGYSISINPKYIINAEECLIRGKITLPSYYKGEPVVGIRHAGTDENPDPNGFKNNTNITHIYWKEQENEPLSL
jgi:hypothetical protein